ncbi:MAG: Hsp20/alpha crystallin family protein [Chloroflexi bacterium]|nr:Hsp20/alpha crystallin family protein [Chloroflexota bacterium]
MTRGEQDKEPEPSDIISGALNIFGLKIDLGQLLSEPEKLSGSLEELREKLKEAGGKEVLSEEEWKSGGISVSGHIRTRGVRGDEEYHIGTAGRPRGREQPTSQPPQVWEPPVDLFVEGEQVVIVADVPGVGLEELELKAEGSVFSLTTKPGARRRYQKDLRVEGELERGSLQATCNNGVLEVHLRKRKSESG